MLFNSLNFAIFLLIVLVLYWSLPHKCRWILVLVASYYFCASTDIRSVFVIFSTTCVTYISARLIEKKEDKKKLILVLSISICIGLLLFFKYAAFVVGIVEPIFHFSNTNVDLFVSKILMPIGISFYVFRMISYRVDVYRGDHEADGVGGFQEDCYREYTRQNRRKVL